MNAPLPNLANVESLPGFRWTDSKPCDECKGSGILYLNSGPSGLHRKCGECDGSGLAWTESDR